MISGRWAWVLEEFEVRFFWSEHFQSSGFFEGFERYLISILRQINLRAGSCESVMALNKKLIFFI